MTHHVGVSASESLVYKNIHEGRLAPDQFLDETAQDTRVGFHTSSKWSFLHKLLAIEEEHDRRRMEWDRIQKIREQSSVTRDQVEKTDLGVPDLLSRWLRDQVLDDCHDETFCDSTTHSPTFGSDSPTLGGDSPTLGGDHRKSEQSGHSQSSTTDVCPAAETTDIYRLLPTRRPSQDHGQTQYLDDISSSPSFHPARLPSIHSPGNNKSPKRRQLRLPPILLPRIYTVAPRPLQSREFLTPTKTRGPISDEEWEDLKNCRYIRHAAPRFALQLSPSNMSLVHY